MNEKEDQQSNIGNRASLRAVRDLLARTLEDVRQRKTTLRHAQTVAALAEKLAKIIEAADIEERVEKIEQVLREQGKMK